MTDQPLRAAAYIRVSTEEQASEGTSLEVQRKRTTAAIESRGWELVEVYADEGVSGSTTSRPALDRLLIACRSGEVQAVIVTKLDRLGRSSRFLENTLGDLDELGVTFVSLSESIDSSSASGRMFRSMLGAMAQFERETIKERTVSGTRAVVAGGFWGGGPPPFGLDVETGPDGKHKRLVINEEEAEVIRTATRMLVQEGLSVAETARRLTGLGLLPREAKRWTRHNLRRVLTHTHLKGSYVWGKKDQPGFRRYGRFGDPIPMKVPAVLEEATWDALQRVLGATALGPRTTTHTYPLSGRLFGLCGRSFFGVYRKERDVRDMRCKGQRHDRAASRCQDRKRLRADDIEKVVWDAVCEVLAEPERLMAMASEFLQVRGEQVEAERDQIEVLEAKIVKLEKALADAYSDGLKAGLDPAALKGATADLDAELAELRRHHARATAWRRDAEAESDRMRKLWDLAEVAHRRMGSMSPEEQAAVLELLDVRVQVFSYEPLRLRVEGLISDEALGQVGNQERGRSPDAPVRGLEGGNPGAGAFTAHDILLRGRIGGDAGSLPRPADTNAATPGRVLPSAPALFEG